MKETKVEEKRKYDWVLSPENAMKMKLSRLFSIIASRRLTDALRIVEEEICSYERVSGCEYALIIQPLSDPNEIPHVSINGIPVSCRMRDTARHPDYVDTIASTIWNVVLPGIIKQWGCFPPAMMHNCPNNHPACQKACEYCDEECTDNKEE